MPAQRRFETLDTSEISRLMKLAIEAGLSTSDLSPSLRRAYGALAAEFGFELWIREQARLQVRRACGRPVQGRDFEPLPGHGGLSPLPLGREGN